MPKYLCVQCGTQYAESVTEPVHCLVCEDDRQFVRWNGQAWTTLETMKAEGFQVTHFEEEPGLWGLELNQSFAINQRALLVPGEKRNIMWDCIPFVDEKAVELVGRLGGLEAIVISHPHYYSTMVEWAETFDVPIYLHEADKDWIMRPSSRIETWSGETLSLTPDVEVIHLGGHFAGSSVLLWRQGAEGQGSLLASDTIFVNEDRHNLSFMSSYSNHIPLSIREVKRIVTTIEAYDFDRIHGSWKERYIWENAKERLKVSTKRYIKQLKS